MKDLGKTLINGCRKLFDVCFKLSFILLFASVFAYAMGISVDLMRVIITLSLVIPMLYVMFIGVGAVVVWAYKKLFRWEPATGSEYIKAQIPLLNNGVYLRYFFGSIGLVALASMIIFFLIGLVYGLASGKDLSSASTSGLTLLILILAFFAIVVAVWVLIILMKQFLIGGHMATVYITDTGLVCEVYHTRGDERLIVAWNDIDAVTVYRAKSIIQIQSRALKQYNMVDLYFNLY